MNVPLPSPAGLKMNLLLWHEWLTGTKTFAEVYGSDTPENPPDVVELLRRCIAAEAAFIERNS